MSRDDVFVEKSLTALLEELESQPEMAIFFASDILGYEDTLSNIREWLEDDSEYGLAYEVMVSLLERFDFKISGKSAVRLLEVGLYFGYKTDLESDRDLDWRT
ncbi:hypothetical protein ACYSTU_14355 [Pseudomonas glycinis]|jgi:hypothetical protein|uniref:hypothetical protein n=1 Tax=unclassified Pseudomonas TaxID=196821 RepID=UPI0009539A83|nr:MULTISPECIES: hypothetical protein [unclassified Pseudomonas]MCW0922005.1 hypothetical protein [Pseudomonas sp. RG1]SIR01695.1 hypothetical protein SAMN05216509_0142 [Pseudomonas sp. B10]